jgi:hypothetical protein
MNRMLAVHAGWKAARRFVKPGEDSMADYWQSADQGQAAFRHRTTNSQHSTRNVEERRKPPNKSCNSMPGSHARIDEGLPTACLKILPPIVDA